MQHLFTVERGQKLCRRLAAELFPTVGIDVGHHEVNILLRQMIKGGTGRKELADKLMVPFNLGLLSRGIRIAIEDMNIIMFNSRRIRELSAVISKKNGEDGREARLKTLAKDIKAGNHRGGGIGIA